MEALSQSVCRSCRTRLATQSTSRAAFSTSSTRRVVPPESPQYVDIPESYQSYLPFAPRAKGILPVPRELFPANRPDKPSREYIKNVTQDPLEKNIKPESELSQVGRYKRKAAEVRKRQLREGLLELYSRKQSELKTMAAKSSRKQAERARLLTQTEREDARLTNASIPKQMQPDFSKSIEALQAEVEAAKTLHAQKKANYERVTNAKEAERMDDLHTLYMNARNFITTMPQMERLIHEQFDTDPNPDPSKRRNMHADFQTNVRKGESMWNFGAPDSVKDMIADATNRPRPRDSLSMISGRGALGSLASQGRSNDVMSDARFKKDQERLKRIAEKLSGGKI